MRRMIHGAWSAALLAIVISGPLRQAAGEEKTDAAGRQYNAAVALQNRGLFDHGGRRVDEVSRRPTRPIRGGIGRLHYLGVCHLKTSQLDSARQCFETVVKTYPKCELLDATYYCLGTTLYSLGQSGKAEMYDAAAAAFQTVATKYPQSKYARPVAVTIAANASITGAREQEAAAMYAQLLAKFPGDRLAADALYALGVSQEELKQQAEAGKSYDLSWRSIPQNPLAAEVTLRRGETLFALGQFEQAAERFAAARPKPDFALADHATVRAGGRAGAVEEIRRGRRPLRLVASRSGRSRSCCRRGHAGRREVLLPGGRLCRGPQAARPGPGGRRTGRRRGRPTGWSAACSRRASRPRPRPRRRSSCRSWATARRRPR